MKIFLSFVLLFLAKTSFPQVTNPDSTLKTPFNTNRIKDAVKLSGSSEVFSYDSLYIWSDKRSLSEIMDERPGYFVFDFGLGGRNDINYNSRSSAEVGIFRDGIQINDNFYQGFDIQNISVNEIDKIEEVSNVSSFFYGINSSAKAINVITKDVFQPQPFSQLRFSQDRFGSLFADVLFSQPFSRRGNVQLGVTKHSLDGRYGNSQFDIWRGRARLNLFLSPRFNAKLNFYLNKFDRGLNDGLVFSPDPDSLTDPQIALVVSPFTNEQLENYYYDLSITGRFLKNNNSLSKIKIYSNNSLRRIKNPVTSGIAPLNDSNAYYHSLLFGISITQGLNIIHNKNLLSSISFGADFYHNLYGSDFFNDKTKFNNNYFSFRTKYDLLYGNYFISAFARNDNIQKRNFLNYGIEASCKISLTKDMKLGFKTGYNDVKYILLNDSYFQLLNAPNLYDSTRRYFEAGVNLEYKYLYLSYLFYFVKHSNSSMLQNSSNAFLNVGLKHFDLSLVLNYSGESSFPNYYLKSNLYYKNKFFRNKLDLRVGVNLKYYNIKYTVVHDQTYYDFRVSDLEFPQENQFIADFYVGARIGKANVSFTVANIFNSLIYNAYVFPLDNRAGFLNSISRFTIVWDFIN